MQPAVIGIPCDNKLLGLTPFQAVGNKYIAAATGGAGGVAILLPSQGSPEQLAGWLDIVDGVLLPGSPSNIEPHHYSDEASRPDNLLDPARDATTLPMIPQLVARGIPLLGICRGFQEMNVAFGGELHQYVHEQPGLRDHRAPQVEDIAEQYAPAHPVHFPVDSWLARWYGAREAMVNSLHGQGVRRLADTLVAEAIAEDGLVEAFRVRDARGFAFAVQWHPEWRYADNPLSLAIFTAFGAACRQYRQSRHA